jgi:hypothetical protein
MNRGPDGFDSEGPMKHRVLVIISAEDGWHVRLDGVDVVSFFGPYAQEWAFREREELAQLLDAQSYGNPLDHRDNVHQIWA